MFVFFFFFFFCLVKPGDLVENINIIVSLVKAMEDFISKHRVNSFSFGDPVLWAALLKLSKGNITGSIPLLKR